jgi:hypothetical protein
MKSRPFEDKFSFEQISVANVENRKRVPLRRKFNKGFNFLTSISKKKNKVTDSESTSNLGNNRKIKLSKIKKINKKHFLFVVAAVLIVVILVPLLFGDTDTRSPESSGSTEVAPAKASIEVNRTFNFPLRDEDNEKVGELEYKISEAELLDEIVVQGQKATAVGGRTFLILNLRIKNDLNQSLEINTKDYVRLSVNGDKDDWLAPDIHNDPVKVQAISTKNTRIGFPINDSDKDLILRVGEINGDKEEVPLEF